MNNKRLGANLDLSNLIGLKIYLFGGIMVAGVLIYYLYLNSLTIKQGFEEAKISLSFLNIECTELHFYNENVKFFFKLNQLKEGSAFNP